MGPFSLLLLFSLPRSSLNAEACPAALPLPNALPYLCPLLSPDSLSTQGGGAGGPRQGLWYSSHVIELYPLSPSLMPAPAYVHTDMTAQACIKVTVGNSEALGVGAWSSTTPAPSSRVRLALDTGCGVVLPKPPAS